jgi:hypothetical protein
VLVKTVVLESVEGDGGLQDIFEVHETEKVLSTAHRGLLDEPDALEAREGAENVFIKRTLRLTSLSEASLGIPSTYRLLVASCGM